MRAGDLRRRLAIEAASDVSDGAGGVERAFAVIDHVFAMVKPRSRREAVESGRITGLATHSIVVRFRFDITGDMRFVDGTRRYRVLVTEPDDPQHRYLRCLCEEEQP